MRGRGLASLVIPSLLFIGAPACGAAQVGDLVDVSGPDGRSISVRARSDHGYSAVWVGALTAWGWDVQTTGDSAIAIHISGSRMHFTAEFPFARLGDQWVQLADAPFLADDALFVPLQVLAELGSADAVGGVEYRPTPSVTAPVVVIDAGHGGRDLGTIGYGGTQEKDIALQVALLLRDRLRETGYDVVLIREDDIFIPIWDRGRIATARKAEAPGVLVSLHVNANPNSRDVRGLETYFLADARTEHERRLAELESQSPDLGEESALPREDLSHILSELRNLDYQRWSARLADVVHDRVAAVHPGPDLGVRQAPLAVLTNALMPSVLVELGYITNGSEEELLNRTDFQSSVAGALADAIHTFLITYPAAQQGGFPARQP